MLKKNAKEKRSSIFTKRTKISSLFPKRGNRNAKRTKMLKKNAKEKRSNISTHKQWLSVIRVMREPKEHICI